MPDSLIRSWVLALLLGWAIIAAFALVVGGLVLGITIARG